MRFKGLKTMDSERIQVSTRDLISHSNPPYKEQYHTLQYLYQHTDWLNSSAIVSSSQEDVCVRKWAEAIIGTGT